MENEERVKRLERVSSRYRRRLDEHDTWFAEQQQKVAELRKQHEDQLALLADHEGMILAHQRRMQAIEDEDKREWKRLRAFNKGLKETRLLVREIGEKLDALIKWDMQRHGYPEGENPPAQ